MIEPILTLLLGILVILAIIAVNGYFVAQEFAYMAVDRTRLAALAAAGDTSAKRALDVTNRTSFTTDSYAVVSIALVTYNLLRGLISVFPQAQQNDRQANTPPRSDLVTRDKNDTHFSLS